MFCLYVIPETTYAGLLGNTNCAFLHGVGQLNQEPPRHTGAVQPEREREEGMILDELGFFHTRGLEVLVFNNLYDGLFSDAKISGIELIHHGVRTVTNGDVRLHPTPGQWDAVPACLDRKVDAAAGSVEVLLEYPDHAFRYRIRVEAEGAGVRIRVILDRPLPDSLAGRAGLNLEFLPSAYFGRAYLADGRGGIFPRYPAGSMKRLEASAGGAVSRADPEPFASGRTFVFAPEDLARRVTVRSLGAALSLYDGRNTAQNGWFVLRSPIPAGASGTAAEWLLEASSLPGWVRRPVVAHSQLGYHPAGTKTAVIELDLNDTDSPPVRLLAVNGPGAGNTDSVPEHGYTVRTEGPAVEWGRYLRYRYLTFDFSSVIEEGLYTLEYGAVRTAPFRIARDVYEAAWHPSLDVFLPVQMDHMRVREAHRVWHGASHLDDARQAPVNHLHFDLYAQGPETDSPYRPGEHIPGLNVGGWFDAGDFDIRTQTQYAVVLDLVRTWEVFEPTRDQTTVDRDARSVEIHVPDGVPDIIQQIGHGAAALLAQHRAVGHAIHGIVEPDLVQYTHLGDAASKTDNLICNPALGPEVRSGFESGLPDDRWAFTSRSSALQYGSAAALAAAGRALSRWDEPVARECLETAVRVWDEEHSHPPHTFRHGNTTGGDLGDEEFQAAVELLLSTGERRFAARLTALVPHLEERFVQNARAALRALPAMDREYADSLERLVKRYAVELDRIAGANPFGVPITEGGWAGSGAVLRFALLCWELHRAFPSFVGSEPVFRGFSFLLGLHPGSDISFVSGVGAYSKEVAYGSNRADFSFIAGGVVPGVLILKPGFPENKEDWPFLWGENEYVVSEAAGFILLAHAVNALAAGTQG